MLAVEKWAQGKHPAIGIIAPMIASFAPDFYEIYSGFKDHKINNRATDLPDLPTWHSLYRNHKRYFEALAEFLGEMSPAMQEAEKLGKHVLNLKANLEDSPRSLTVDEVNNLHESSDNLRKTAFDEIRENLENTSIEAEKRQTGLRLWNDHQTELLFMYFVFTPCLLFYKTNPGRLYHRARLGEVNAIDALLRLDPLMLHDPAIGKQIQKIRLSKRGTYVNLIEAPLKPIKAKISKGRIRAILGSLILMQADKMKAPLLSTDIRELFDAMVKDATKHDIDTTLPNSDEAFYKSLQRNRDDWKKIIPTGQKKVIVVSG